LAGALDPVRQADRIVTAGPAHDEAAISIERRRPPAIV
jgi:hypothetical protein